MKSDDDMKLTRYALGEMDPNDPDRAAVEARVWNDPAARAEVDAIREVARRLSDELANEPAPAARPIEVTAVVTKRRPGWRGRLAVAAAVALVVGGAGFAVLAPSLQSARRSAMTVSDASNVRHAPQPQQQMTLAAPSAKQDEFPLRYSTQAAGADSTSSPVTVGPEQQGRSGGNGHFLGQQPEAEASFDPSLMTGLTGGLPAQRPSSSFSLAGPPQSADGASAPFGVPGRKANDILSGDVTAAKVVQQGQPQQVGGNVALRTGLESGGRVELRYERGEALAQGSRGGIGAGDRTFKDQRPYAFFQEGERPAVERERRLLAEQIVAEDHRGFNTEAYDRVVDNAFLDVMHNPLSTFSIDVDTASYSNVRRFLTSGRRPPKDAVRIEELINYFPYDYAPPGSKDEKPFATHVEVAACPWQPEHRLVRVGIKGREIARDKRPASNLVFLLDVSGSMRPENKLPLVKRAMRMLLEELGGEDRVAIVVYAGSSGLVLPSTSCAPAEKQSILNAIENLSAGGSTNGEQGIQLAYSIAKKNFIEGGTNRVILCTDGDFNVGVTNQGELTRTIEEKAKGGVFLSVLGFGMGNLKDSTMEKLADKGNGNYAYIDTLQEAKKVLVEQMSGTLVTIAKDVKIQIEFNPSVLGSYRLIGYENRLLAKEDFNDDKKDAGEIGAGHAVTALYEVVPAGKTPSTAPAVDQLGDAERRAFMAVSDAIAAAEAAMKQAADEPSRQKWQRRIDDMHLERDQLLGRARPAAATTTTAVDPLRYQKPAAPTGDSREMLTLKLRFKQPDGDTSALIETPVTDSGATFARASGEFKFASAVAAFGMILRDSPHKGSATLGAVTEWAQDGLGADNSGYRAEFIELVKRAKEIP